MKVRISIFIGVALLCFSILSKAQTTIFSETFNAAPNWTINTAGNSLIIGSLPNPGGTPNSWVINNVGTSVDGSNNLHITCTGFICNLLGAPGPVYNASSAANNTNTAATMNTDILSSAFTGTGPYTLSFQWICDGASNPTNGSGKLIYSIDGGLNWIEHSTNYNGNGGAAITESIDMSTLVGFTPTVNNIRLGFRWFNIGTTGHTDPPMIVDNISITTPSTSNTVTTGAITGSPFCAGATFNVPFTSTGTFAAGNVYTAQLSDAAGSFASPTNIGTFNSSANSGTISATIPGGTPAGSGYLIRVISSNPSINGSSSLAFTINTPITPTFSAIADVCQNAAPPLLPNTSNNGIAGTWSPVVSTNTPGTTVYTFTPNTGQCATTATLSITVNPTVTPTFSQTFGPVCQGNNTVLLPQNSSNVPSIVGSWTPFLQINTTNVGTTTYTFTPNAGQCASVFNVDITITPPNITPTFTQIGPLCIGSVPPALPVLSTNSPAITGTWSPSVINTAASGITTYTFTPDAGQCAVIATMNIEITNSITPTFSQTFGPVCQGNNTVLLPQNSSNVPSIVGSWTPFLQINTTNVGTTTYTFTPNAGQCASVFNVDITITPPNITPTFTQIGPLCIGSVPPALPVLSTNSPAITGTWSPSVINTAASGITTYTFTPDAGQCAVVTTLDISVASSITPTFAAIGPLCIGTLAPLLPTASSNLPAITGTWLPATINTVNAGTTTYTFTPDPNQCATNSTLDIVVTNSIAISFAAIQPICQGAIAPILPLVSNNNPPITGTWNPALISTSTVGTTSYTFTPDPGQCAAATSLDVEVISTPQAPSIAISADVTTICAGQNVNFTATPNSSNTGDIIQWFVNGTAITGATGLLFSSNSLSNNDQITAVFTPSSSCLAGQTATSNLLVITVNPVVTPSISISASSTQLCSGENVVFTATLSGGGSNPQIQWYINGNAVAGANQVTFSTPNLSNSDNVTAQLISNLACATPSNVTSNSLVITITPLANPTISISADKSVICEGQQIVFNATTAFGGNAPQFIWQIGNNTISTNDPQYITTGITANTSVTCTLVSNFLCTTNDSAVSNTLSIDLKPVPAVLLSSDVTIQQGESTTLTATTATDLNYLWSPSTALSCADCTEAEANPEESTTYTFVVTDPVTNCSASDSLVVTVIRTFDVWVPSAFSPNKDNINDNFYVRGNNIKDFTLKIYDRWGAMMFQTSNVNDGWNGEYEGRVVNAGIYVYSLDYTLKDGMQSTMKGNITVSN